MRPQAQAGEDNLITRELFKDKNMSATSSLTHFDIFLLLRIENTPPIKI
jgi:hypothetical protein